MAGVKCKVFGVEYNTRSEVLYLCNLSSAVVSRRAKADNISFDEALEKIALEKSLYVDGHFIKKMAEPRGPKGGKNSCKIFDREYDSKGDALKEFNVSHTSVSNIMAKFDLTFEKALEKYATDKGLYVDGEIVKNVKGATRGSTKIVRCGVTYNSLEEACEHYGISKFDVVRERNKRNCNTQLAFDYAVAKAENDSCIVFNKRYKNSTAAANAYDIPVREVRDFMKENDVDFGSAIEKMISG